jgi:hypothetical protein
MSKTVTEVLDYIVEHYRTHPRSVGFNPDSFGVSKGVCLYNGKNGAKCAFALLCHPIDAHFDEPSVAATKVLSKNPLGLDILLPEFRYISGLTDVNLPRFFLQVQSLHDNAPYWVQNGKGGQDLTPVGLLFRDALEKSFT